MEDSPEKQLAIHSSVGKYTCIVDLFLQPVSYSTDNSSVNVSWEGFTDPESGVSSYEISLWKNESCLEGSETTLVNDWIKLSSNYSFYQFVDQILEV